MYRLLAGAPTIFESYMEHKSSRAAPSCRTCMGCTLERQPFINRTWSVSLLEQLHLVGLYMLDAGVSVIFRVASVEELLHTSGFPFLFL